MIKQFKRLAALTLAALMVSGCAAAAPEKETAPVAMGRYIETEVTLPKGAGYILNFTAREGGGELLCNLNPRERTGPWKLFRSENGGESWSGRDASWLNAVTDSGGLLESVNRDSAGNWYLTLFDRDADKTNIIRLDTAGNPLPLPGELPDTGESSHLNGITATDGGDLLALYRDKVVQLDAATMVVKNEYAAKSYGANLPFFTYDDTLVLSDYDGINFYDLTTGEKTSSQALKETFLTHIISSTGDRGAARVFSRGTDGALYIGDKNGLYRHVEDGVVLERFVDGERTSLNMPSLTFTDLIVNEDGSLLALFASDEGALTGGENSSLLLRYRYSADTPTVPARELNLYSLYDNKTVRQAMGLFQRQSPDIHVMYTVGVPDDGTVLPSDALRTLSAELLAGKGPDLLVLDKLPIDAYIEKGVLSDLSALVDEKTASGELLKNAANAFRRSDGSVYAIPARFAAPVMVVNSDVSGRLTDLTALADYLTTEKAEHGDDYKAILKSCDPMSLIDQFYPLCAPVWQNDGGSLNEAAFRQFLTDLKKLYDLKDHSGDSEGGIYYSSSSIIDAIIWARGAIPLAVGNLLSLSDLPTPAAAIAEKGGGELKILTGQQKGVFLPLINLGVNAQSPVREDAMAFLTLMLSETVQEKSFADGLPVNAASFAKGLENPFADPSDSINYGTMLEKELYMLEITWADEAFMNETAAKITALDVPSALDETIQMMLYDETADFFAGRKSLDDTVKAFATKLNLYRSE